MSDEGGDEELLVDYEGPRQTKVTKKGKCVLTDKKVIIRLTAAEKAAEEQESVVILSSDDEISGTPKSSTVKTSTPQSSFIPSSSSSKLVIPLPSTPQPSTSSATLSTPKTAPRTRKSAHPESLILTEPRSARKGRKSVFLGNAEKENEDDQESRYIPKSCQDRSLGGIEDIDLTVYRDLDEFVAKHLSGFTQMMLESVLKKGVKNWRWQDAFLSDFDASDILTSDYPHEARLYNLMRHRLMSVDGMPWWITAPLDEDDKRIPERARAPKPDTTASPRPAWRVLVDELVDEPKEAVRCHPSNFIPWRSSLHCGDHRNIETYPIGFEDAMYILEHDIRSFDRRTAARDELVESRFLSPRPKTWKAKLEIPQGAPPTPKRKSLGGKEHEVHDEHFKWDYRKICPQTRRRIEESGPTCTHGDVWPKEGLVDSYCDEEMNLYFLMKERYYNGLYLVRHVFEHGDNAVPRRSRGDPNNTVKGQKTSIVFEDARYILENGIKPAMNKIDQQEVPRRIVHEMKSLSHQEPCSSKQAAEPSSTRSSLEECVKRLTLQLQNPATAKSVKFFQLISTSSADLPKNEKMMREALMEIFTPLVKAEVLKRRESESDRTMKHSKKLCLTKEMEDWVKKIGDDISFGGGWRSFVSREGKLNDKLVELYKPLPPLSQSKAVKEVMNLSFKRYHEEADKRVEQEKVLRAAERKASRPDLKLSVAPACIPIAGLHRMAIQNATTIAAAKTYSARKALESPRTPGTPRTPTMRSPIIRPSAPTPNTARSGSAGVQSNRFGDIFFPESARKKTNDSSATKAPTRLVDSLNDDDDSDDAFKDMFARYRQPRCEKENEADLEATLGRSTRDTCSPVVKRTPAKTRNRGPSSTPFVQKDVPSMLPSSPEDSSPNPNHRRCLRRKSSVKTSNDNVKHRKITSRA